MRAICTHNRLKLLIHSEAQSPGQTGISANTVRSTSLNIRRMRPCPPFPTKASVSVRLTDTESLG